MATKSILKTVNISSRNICRDFVNALERAEKASCQRKEFSSVKCKEIKGSEIKELFK